MGKEGKRPAWLNQDLPAKLKSPYSSESQLYSGLHQKKHGQQGKGGDPAPPLCAGEASPGVVHPNVHVSPVLRTSHVGMYPEEGHKNDTKDGSLLQ